MSAPLFHQHKQNMKKNDRLVMAERQNSLKWPNLATLAISSSYEHTRNASALFAHLREQHSHLSIHPQPLAIIDRFQIKQYHPSIIYTVKPLLLDHLICHPNSIVSTKCNQMQCSKVTKYIYSSSVLQYTRLWYAFF